MIKVVIDYIRIRSANLFNIGKYKRQTITHAHTHTRTNINIHTYTHTHTSCITEISLDILEVVHVVEVLGVVVVVADIMKVVVVVTEAVNIVEVAHAMNLNEESGFNSVLYKTFGTRWYQMISYGISWY